MLNVHCLLSAMVGNTIKHAQGRLKIRILKHCKPLMIESVRVGVDILVYKCNAFLLQIDLDLFLAGLVLLNPSHDAPFPQVDTYPIEELHEVDEYSQEYSVNESPP